MESWLLTTVLGILILYLMYWLLKQNVSYWEKRHVPYVKSPPLIGSMSDVISGKLGFLDVITYIYKKLDGEKFGGYFQFVSPILMIRDPELINQVLIKDFTYFEDRGPPINNSDDILKLALSSLVGDEWRNVRHKLTPTFTSSKLKMMFDPIKECSYEVISYLENKTGQDIEARGLLLRYILNVIGNVAFGLKLDTLNESDEQSVLFFEKSSQFFKPSFLLFVKLMVSLSFPKLRDNLKLKLTDSGVQTFFRKLSHDVIHHREETNERRNDFLQLMLDLKEKEKLCPGNELRPDVSNDERQSMESEDKELLDQLKNTPLGSYESSKLEMFTDDFISSQAFLFISGGSETTASSLNFVIYELAANQDLQEKIHDEVCEVISSHEFSYQAVKKMIYLEQFINETFRLHPVTPGIIRVCTRSYKIPGTDIVLEKGNYITIPVAGLHNDPQYFPDPEKFNPDRFVDMDAVPKGVYLPFGGGPRMCIAKRLAMLEMKILIATILMNYRVVLSEKTKVPIKLEKKSFLALVEGGVWVGFEKRNPLQNKI